MDKNYQIVYAFIAYDDVELLERKIKFLYTPEDFFIVHWNRYSCKKKLRQLQKAFQDYPNVHIYSKVKVVWGMYSILLAMLENMKRALRLAGDFDHFISLSEQCVPVKTKEYIKGHLAKYRGKSFCGSVDMVSDDSFGVTPCPSQPFLLTGYFAGARCDRIPITLRAKLFLYAVGDFCYYFMPVLRDRKKIWDEMKKARSFHVLQEATGMKKAMLMLGYILCFPLRFMLVSLERFNYVGRYARPAPLLSLCPNKIFRWTKNTGPAACYCQEDVQYLCRPENLELAHGMRRYHAPEEYFCQTLLYHSRDHRKNFLDESLCLTNYEIGNINDVLHYADCLQFPHACFVRKVSDHQIYQDLEKYLLEEEIREKNS